VIARRVRCALVVLGALAGVSAAAPPSDQVPLLERQYLTGDWNGIRPLLEADGFRPYLTYTGTLWSNLAGGLHTGVRVNGYLDFGLEIDLAKLGTWDGLGFHADFH
jgi:carbohydrate-selective porin OprB